MQVPLVAAERRRARPAMQGGRVHGVAQLARPELGRRPPGARRATRPVEAAHHHAVSPRTAGCRAHLAADLRRPQRARPSRGRARAARRRRCRTRTRSPASAGDEKTAPSFRVQTVLPFASTASAAPPPLASTVPTTTASSTGRGDVRTEPAETGPIPLASGADVDADEHAVVRADVQHVAGEGGRALARADGDGVQQPAACAVEEEQPSVGGRHDARGRRSRRARPPPRPRPARQTGDRRRAATALGTGPGAGAVAAEQRPAAAAVAGAQRGLQIARPPLPRWRSARRARGAARLARTARRRDGRGLRRGGPSRRQETWTGVPSDEPVQRGSPAGTRPRRRRRRAAADEARRAVGHGDGVGVEVGCRGGCSAWARASSVARSWPRAKTRSSGSRAVKLRVARRR